jgi:hypothetical protein
MKRRCRIELNLICPTTSSSLQTSNTKCYQIPAMHVSDMKYVEGLVVGEAVRFVCCMRGRHKIKISHVSGSLFSDTRCNRYESQYVTQ